MPHEQHKLVLWLGWAVRTSSAGRYRTLNQGTEREHESKTHTSQIAQFSLFVAFERVDGYPHKINQYNKNKT